MLPPIGRTLPDLLREKATLAPDATAIFHKQETVSYAQLYARSQTLAATLRFLGIKRGDRIGLLMENRPEWLVILFATNAIGATLVPYSTWSKPAELAFLLNDSEVSTLIMVSTFGNQNYADDLLSLMPELKGHSPSRDIECERFPCLKRIIMLGQSVCGTLSCSALTKSEPLEPLPPGEGPSATDDALILYSSGSTSTPKGVRLQHYSLIENGFNIGERMGMQADDRILLIPPLFWAYGSANALPATLSHGAALVLVDRFDPKAVPDIVAQHECSIMYTLPSITAAVLDQPGFDVNKMRTLRTGLTIGSPQDVRLVAEKLGITQICNVYGASETCGNCCVTPHHWSLEERVRSQGLPLPGVDIRIIDPKTREPQPHGKEGEVEVKGYLMRGYWGASSGRNSEALTHDSYLRTSDLGLIEPNGAFIFMGRSDEMIKRDGINISPFEIEDVLLVHPHVSQAAVVGTPDPVRGSRVTAFVVLNGGGELSEADLEAHCRDHASRYKVPDRFTILSALPSTNTGKVLRRALRDMAAEMDNV